MNLAISTVGATLDSDVDPRFGRARFFIIVDDRGGLVRVIDNSGSDELPHGAGVAAVESMVRNGVGAVVTGQVGPKAEQGLRAAGIAIHTGASGPCRKALAEFLAPAKA